MEPRVGRWRQRAASWRAVSAAAWANTTNRGLGVRLRRWRARASLKLGQNSSEGAGWMGSQKSRRGRPASTMKSPSGPQRRPHHRWDARRANRRALAPRAGGVWAAQIQARLSQAGPPRRHQAARTFCRNSRVAYRQQAAKAGATSQRSSHPRPRAAAALTAQPALARTTTARASRGPRWSLRSLV